MTAGPARRRAAPGKAGERDGQPATRKPAAEAPPRVRAPKTPAAPSEPAPPGSDPRDARSLLRAGLKALGDMPGDMVARQARIFELLLGIGQSPVWSPGARPTEPADAD